LPGWLQFNGAFNTNLVIDQSTCGKITGKSTVATSFYWHCSYSTTVLMDI